MTKTEFIEKIDNGSDIMFDVAGKHFSVFTWMKTGIGIGEQHPNDNEAIRCFQSADELLNSFCINGIALNDLVNDIHITDYT